jgi:2-polyprenyl-3-methyl-5-hydroxy-6-metoxy-1,4-benzoquinol methylase
MTETSPFWEARAARYAADGRGLRAVCSFAMPGFYNGAIDLTQRCSLHDLIESIPNRARVLDYGCGIGRWSHQIARRGAQVTGVDFSEAMLAQARARTERTRYEAACRFLRADVTSLELDQQFDVVFGVTVLQHVMDDGAFAEAVQRLASHVRPGGRLIMLEAAPSTLDVRADTDTFHARTLESYLTRLRTAGLIVEQIRGVDPLPFKLWVVPKFRSWPRPLALAALALATAAALPLDVLLGQVLTHRSWHKVIVARAPGGLS